ncbi:MAG: hypothetical protein Q7T01_01180 [bacterium]|nr:hypothetical protein [bacterium]
MRGRIIIAATVLGLLMLVAATQWRRVFPYVDHIAPRAADDAAVYAHVAMTRSVRAGLLQHLNALAGASDITVLRSVIADATVRELGVAWGTSGAFVYAWREEASNKGVGEDASILLGNTSIIVRQLVGGEAVTLPLHAHHPLHVLVRTQELFDVLRVSSDALAQVPDALRFGGVLRRDGTLALQTDARTRRFARSVRVVSLMPREVGAVTLFGVPTSLFPSAFAALASDVTSADVAFHARTGSFILRLPAAVSDAALLESAAALAPRVVVRMLDGYVARVARVDSREFTVRWEGAMALVERAGEQEPVLVAARGQSETRISNRHDIIERIADGDRFPGACFQKSPMIAVYAPLSPQVSVLASASEDFVHVSICGFIGGGL